MVPEFNFTAVLQIITGGLFGLAAYLLNHRLLKIERSQEESKRHEEDVSTHLGKLNGRVAVVETKVIEAEKHANFIEEQHKETRRQCQANNRREFDEIRGIFGRRATDRQNEPTD